MEPDTKRPQKLVAFRELERDRASMAVFSARSRTESAKRAVENQRATVEKEQDKASVDKGSFDPNEMQLSLACIEASRDELKEREALLSQAESDLEEKAAKLMITHKKVQQMELLFDKAVQEKAKMENNKEQREIDDLATNREARK